MGRSALRILLAVTTMLLLGLASGELRSFTEAPKRDGSLKFSGSRRLGPSRPLQPDRSRFSVGRELDIDFVVSTGDNFYDNGLTSEHDKNFEESFTNVYTAGSLQKQWYSVLGNHDYRGDAEAQLSPFLRQIDPRWICLRSFLLNAELVDIIFVDTNPFVDEYFVQPNEHTYDWRGIPFRKAYIKQLLQDVELALKRSTTKWKIVVGHHAIRSIGHHGDTRELIEHLLPILKTYDVDFYINGHDHCQERVTDTESPLQFLTSGAGSKAWRGDIKKTNRENVKFYYDGQGFMSVQLTAFEAEIAFYDVFGNVMHRWVTSKQLLHPSI